MAYRISLPHPVSRRSVCRRSAVILSVALIASRAAALEVFDEAAWTGEGELPVAAQADRGSATITVGSATGCDFSSLQPAINSAVDGDRLQLMDETFSGTFRISSKALTIVGGYPDCDPASSAGGRSTLDGGSAGPVMDIFYPATSADPVRPVILENLIIQNGGGVGFFSGGVLVEGLPGRLETRFNNVQISDNERTGTADNGAGLRIETTGDSVSGGTFGAAMVSLDNRSSVLRNSAGGDGGGIHCRSDDDLESTPVTVLRLGTTLVFDNEAENGGGVALDGCRNVFLYSGGPIVLIFPTGGILGNTARTSGGGLFLDNQAEAWMRSIEFLDFGDSTESALIASNSADFSGGAEVTGGSFLRLEDTYVTGNTAALFDGGVGVGLEGELEIGRRASAGECPQPVSGGGVLSRPPCSVIENNTAENVGGVGATTGAKVDIGRTIFRANEAAAVGGVSAFRAIGVTTFPPTELRAEGVLVHGNVGDYVLKAQGVTSMTLSHSTVAGNDADIALVTAPSGQQAIFDVLSSILIAAGGSSVLTEDGSGTASTTASCVITNRALADTDFDLAPAYSEIDDPLFRDAANDDFRLRFRSPAIDYCNSASGSEYDGLDGGERGTPWAGPQPDPNPAGSSGDYDLGAYERPWEAQPADLAVEVVTSGTFLAQGESVALELLVVNNGPQTAFGEIDVVDDFDTAQLTNQQWTCAPPPGVTCTPASGSGDVNAVIGDLQPGQSVTFDVSADPADPNADLEFLYTMIAVESAFNVDSNPGNNDVVVEFTAGLFADGFESGSP